MRRTGRTGRAAILNLPDELLDHILTEVKWGAPAPPFALDALQFHEKLGENTASIQRVRQTCRRLASRASALLLPVATVSISDPSSVDRLEQIASHGAFAPYVKAVHVYLGVYEADLAADIRLLAAHLLHVWRGSSLLAGPVWTRTLNDLDAFCYDEIDANDGRESMRLLRREHAEYRRRYEAQQQLSPSATLERIAKAMARMPRATRLVLDDGPDTPPHSAAAAPGDGGWLVGPTRWATAFKLSRGSPPIDMLFGLPIAVHQAGVELTGLRINRLRLPSAFPLWLDPQAGWDAVLEGPLPPEVDELRAACSSLRVFEFTPGYEPDCWPTASPTHLAWPGMATSLDRPRRELHEALDWILAASSRLTHVRVDLQMVHGGVPHELAMPAPPWPWPHLQVLYLQDGTVEAHNLARFLSTTARTLTALHLDGMYLCSQSTGHWQGPVDPYSWSSVVDQLREYACSSDRGLTIRLRRPRGAEFEDRSVSDADVAHLRALFQPDDDSGLSAVDRFVHGLADRNPLVEAGMTRRFYP